MGWLLLGHDPGSVLTGQTAEDWASEGARGWGAELETAGGRGLAEARGERAGQVARRPKPGCRGSGASQMRARRLSDPGAGRGGGQGGGGWPQGAGAASGLSSPGPGMVPSAASGAAAPLFGARFTGPATSQAS